MAHNFLSENPENSIQKLIFRISWIFLFFFIYVSIMIFRATLHVASFIENQFTINAKSSAFSYINRYRAFKFRYTWIMVARLKVNIYILFSLFFIHFSRAAPVTKSLIWKQKRTKIMINIPLKNEVRLMNLSVTKLELVASILIETGNLMFVAFRSQHHQLWPLCISLVQKCWNYHVDWMLFHQL